MSFFCNFASPFLTILQTMIDTAWGILTVLNISAPNLRSMIGRTLGCSF